MKIFILTLCLFASVLGSPLLGSSSCTWGPSYWCSKAKAAKECNTVEHCLKNVWPKASVPSVQESGMCATCEMLMGELVELVQRQATQDEVKDLLERGCSAIPDTTYQQECKSAVDEFTPLIIQLIAQEVDPKTVCALIDLCKSQIKAQSGSVILHKAGELPAAFKTALEAAAKTARIMLPLKTKMAQELATSGLGDMCSDCKEAMQGVLDYVTENTTEAEVENFLDQKLCAQFGPLEDTCKQLVSEYTPAIFQMLQNKATAGELCQTIGLCSQRKELIAKPAAAKKVSASGECTLCTLIMKEVEGQLSNNATEAEIVKLLESVCSVLPSAIRGECQAFVQQYATAIFNLVVLEVNPKEICTLIGLCLGSKKTTLKDSSCELCTLVVTYVQNQLKQNQSVAEIEKALDEICALLPTALAPQCDQLVQQYGPTIIKMLSQLVDPTQVCKELGLCSAKAHLLGADLCTRGPAYWCASPDNARQCQAESHCKAHVWMN